MPYRMIKDSLRTSRNVSSLTDFQFRVWISLITYVDDYGRGSADAELLKGLLFPRRHGVTEKQIRDALGTLASKGMVNLYTVDDEPYFYFPKWGEHQRIRTKVSKFPEPPADCGGSRQIAADCGEMRLETKPNQTKPETRNQKPNQTKPECETKARTREGEEDAGFDAFWSAYPRKSGDIKAAYMEYLHAMDTGATPDMILAALKWQSEEWRREGQPQYIPSPQRWLENRRWEESPRDSAGADTSNIFLQIIEEGRVNDTR